MQPNPEISTFRAFYSDEEAPILFFPKYNTAAWPVNSDIILVFPDFFRDVFSPAAGFLGSFL